MNVRTMIETAVGALNEQDRARMRSAMELGARFALEAVIQLAPYSSDAKEVLGDLEGMSAALPDAAPIEPAATPAPASEPEPVNF